MNEALYQELKNHINVKVARDDSWDEAREYKGRSKLRFANPVFRLKIGRL
jgi:hypothetical protein